MLNLFVIICVLRSGYAFRANLYTGKACRQCIRYKKIFNKLVIKYPEVEFNNIEISGNGVDEESYMDAKNLKIHAVPTIVFQDKNGEEEDRFVCVPRNYDQINETCEKYNDIMSKDKTTSLPVKKCQWLVENMDTKAGDVLSYEHLRLAKLCENMYTDSFMKSREQHVENTVTDTQCGMSVHGNQLIVCFRGSDSVTDWRMNFYTTLSEFPYGSGRFVHAGFLAQWMSVQSEVTSKLMTLMDKYSDTIEEVVFCGHSAGTTASLAAYILEPVIKETFSKKTKIVTFGSPRYCNDKFKEYIEKRVECTRIVLDRDVITRAPLPIFGYVHVGKAIQIRENCIIQRDTTTIESIHWMILGLPRGDIGVRDHFINNYRDAISGWLTQNEIEIEEDSSIDLPVDALDVIVESEEVPEEAEEQYLSSDENMIEDVDEET